MSTGVSRGATLGSRKRRGQKKCRTRGHVIADLSVNFVERSILQCGYSAERIAHDYGIDLLLFTYAENGEIENGHVYLQLKATDGLPLLADGRTIPFPVAIADLNYWRNEPMPVILVQYDAKSNRAYWLYVQNYVNETAIESEDIDAEQETVTVRIPTANRVGPRAVRKFREFKESILAQVKGGARHGK
jgi:hypothetical protein